MKKTHESGIIYGYRQKDIDRIIYVGQTYSDTEKQRQYRHKYLSTSVKKDEKSFSSSKFYRKTRKHGWDSFEYVVLEKDIPTPGGDKTLLDEREQYWISYYDTHNNGCNLTEGGKGSKGHAKSEELIKKLSESTKKKLWESDEYRKKTV